MLLLDGQLLSPCKPVVWPFCLQAPQCNILGDKLSFNLVCFMIKCLLIL